jgi:hypothetical protein
MLKLVKRSQVNRGKRSKDLFNSLKEEMSLTPLTNPLQKEYQEAISLSNNLSEKVLDPLLGKKQKEDYEELMKTLKNTVERIGKIANLLAERIGIHVVDMMKTEEWKDLGIIKQNQILESIGRSFGKFVEAERMYQGKDIGKKKNDSYPDERTPEQIQREIGELDALLGNNKTIRQITLTEIAPIVDKGNGKMISVESVGNS